MRRFIPDSEASDFEDLGQPLGSAEFDIVDDFEPPSPVQPFRLTRETFFRHIQTARGRAVLHTYAFLRASVGYASQMLPTALPVLSDSISSAQKLPIFLTIREVVKNDALPVFFAWYLYYLAEDMFAGSEVARIGLVGLYYTVSLFSVFRALQFYLYKGIISSELSRNFYTFSKIFHEGLAKKNDNMLLPSRDPAICASCTDSRVIKGVSRSVVFYTARQIFFDSLDRVPILSNILSPFVLPLSIFMRGQDAFDFVLSEQYCERHVRVNLREYSELFLTFGLVHYAIVQLVLFAMMALKNVASKQLLYTLPENTFLVSQMLVTLQRMPIDSLERYVSGTAFLFFIGLASYYPFPKVVKESKRFSPDAIAYWIAEKLVDITIIDLKKAFKEEAVPDRFDEMDAKSTDTNGERFIKNLKETKKSVARYFMSFFVKPNSAPQKKQLPLPKMIRMYDRIITSAESMHYYGSGLANQFFLNKQHQQLWIKIWLPTAFHSRFNFLEDPIFKRVAPALLAKTHATLDAFLGMRTFVVEHAEWAETINNLFSRQSMQIVSAVLGVNTIRKMLTYEFIVDSKTYITEMTAVLRGLRRWGFLSKEQYQEKKEKLISFEKKLGLVVQALKEISPQSRKEILVFLASEECLHRLEKIQVWIQTFLEKHPKSMALLPTHMEMISKEDPCLAESFRVETLPAGTCVRFHGEEMEIEKPVVTTAAAPARALPAPTGSEEFEEIPAGDSDAFRQEYSSSGFQEARGSSLQFFNYGVRRAATAVVAAVTSSGAFSAPRTEPSFQQRQPRGMH